MRMKLLALCLASSLAAGCGGDGGNRGDANAAEPAGEPKQAQTSIGDALAGSVDHAAFLQMLQSAGLAETLRGVGPYTVFAPTDAAFDALPEDVRARLGDSGQRERLVALLSYHIVPGTVTTEDLGNAIDRAPGGRAELRSVTGDNLALTRDGEAILVGDGSDDPARIVAADRLQANGVLHGIDAVLMPGGGE